MAEVDHAAQRNTAAAQQLNATAIQMADQAEKLERLMDFFKGKNSTDPSAAGTPHGVDQTREDLSVPWRNRARVTNSTQREKTLFPTPAQTARSFSKKPNAATPDSEAAVGRASGQFTRF